MEADDDGLYVVKFRGAGQGPKALVAELVVGELARGLGLPVPDIVLVDLDPGLGAAEPDPEIQDLLRASRGINVGLRFLEGAFNFAPGAAGDLVTAEFAARLVWLDAFITNPDRTDHNPNLLVWNREPWLIDHGAALYAHHNWEAVDDARTRTTFPLIEKHVLLIRSELLMEEDARATGLLTRDVLEDVLRQIPADLLAPDGEVEEAEMARARYLAYLTRRLEGPREWVTEAEAARKRVLSAPPRHLHSRR
jgi:hypothetical protein